ncbi:hypothetical protein A176_000721 [Myxococcus hansupus]|uniref:Lipoprotein n=1 Tax=Pseudomyxococcus hansupus TaxID=1297742 RepID=A0A0H4WM26_9BACT|nr:hypothetical protein [Myxococcus hansupus]AKQ63809.1 hypothetical protein A176_000721 [Myxococcus hansupus]
MRFQRFALAAMSFACTAAMAAEPIQPPWGKESNLGEKMMLEGTSVCTDGKGHFVALTPDDEDINAALYYGDGKQFVQVAHPGPYTSPTSFLDPRFFNKGSNPNFRGIDWRVMSEVEIDRKERTCKLRCGEKDIPLTMLEGEPAAEVLRKSTYLPNPQKFRPYALLRDTKGVYYFVDRGFHESEKKNYRVFIGPRGGLKAQKMTNVISDSEGEIFSTKRGDLRLLLDKAKPAMWIENTKRRHELRQVPVDENLPLIYNELGVYEGLRLGTPCDDQ